MHSGEAILIVEDKPEVRGLPARILERLGYMVIEADGLAAARRIPWSRA